jgi:hypothetical protein
METYKTAPLLVPAVQQQPRTEHLSSAQVEEAVKMGIKGLTTKNTQKNMLKLVKFQVKRIRHTSKYIKNLTHKHGRKLTKVILNKAFNTYGHL